MIKVGRRHPLDIKVGLADLLRDFHLEKVRIRTGIADLHISHQSKNKDAAWELYIEMLTRVVTQRLPSESGDEKTALDSMHSLFHTTREILRRYGRGAMEFSKIAVPILNQVVRPFTTKWHRECQSGAFDDKNKRLEFRRDLEALLVNLCDYSRLLAKIAGVEDLTDLETTEDEQQRTSPVQKNSRVRSYGAV